jgi:HEAT repeat protein
MTTVLLYVVAGLAAVNVLLVLLIVAIRAVMVRRRNRIARLREPVELSLADFLAGGPDPAVPTTRDERAVMLDIALAALADLRGGERARLAGYLERYGYGADAVAALQSRSRIKRQRAAETLASLAGPAVVPALTASLADRDPLVRTACARTLAETGGEDLVPRIVDTARRDELTTPGAGAAVVLALGRHRPGALAALLSPREPPQVRLIAVRIAGELRLSEHAALLLEALDGPDRLAAEAAAGLGRIGEVRAVGPLSALALDEDRAPEARAAAVTGLGAIGDPAATGVAERLLGSGDWRLMDAAARALGQLGEPGNAVLRQAVESGRPASSELALAVLEPEAGPEPGAERTPGAEHTAGAEHTPGAEHTAEQEATPRAGR